MSVVLAHGCVPWCSASSLPSVPMVSLDRVPGSCDWTCVGVSSNGVFAGPVFSMLGVDPGFHAAVVTCVCVYCTSCMF